MRFPYSSEIAGISHYCTINDEGDYTGYTKAEETNPYDKNAIAIYLDSGKLVGYIPKYDNINFRIWSKGKTNLKCFIRIRANEGYKHTFFDTQITVFDTYPIDEQNPLYGKNIHFSGDTDWYIDYGFGLKEFCESYGAIVGNLKKATDYVVYDKGVTDTVKAKSENDAYHFQMITYWDLVKLATSRNNENNKFFGKNVAFSYVYNSDVAKQKYILQYLIENGANISFRYNKGVDIVIDRKEYGKVKIAQKAETDGKEIILDTDLIKSYGYEISDKDANAIIQKSAAKQETTGRTPKIEVKSVSIEFVDSKDSKDSKNDDNGNTGCIIAFVVVALLTLGYWISKLIF